MKPPRVSRPIAVHCRVRRRNDIPVELPFGQGGGEYGTVLTISARTNKGRVRWDKSGIEKHDLSELTADVPMTEHFKAGTKTHWLTADGHWFKITDMQTTHLQFTVLRVRRWARNALMYEMLSNCKAFRPGAMGDAAELAVEGELSALASMTLDQYAANYSNAHKPMLVELKRRGVVLPPNLLRMPERAIENTVKVYD